MQQCTLLECSCYRVPIVPQHHISGPYLKTSEQECKWTD